MNGVMNENVAEMTGLPVAPRKKAHRGTRGRGKSKTTGVPGHEHHLAHVKAHAEGNHAEAKLHALNYAKAITNHLAAQAEPASTEPDGNSMSAQPMAPRSNKMAAVVAALKNAKGPKGIA